MSAVISPAAKPFVGWVRAVRKTGWPVATGLLAFLAGLVMLVAGLVLAARTQSPSTAETQPDARIARPATALPRAGAAAFEAPRFETHLDDVAVIFAIAAEHGVAVGAVDYKTEAQASLPVVVRTLDLRLAEDYPKFKPFVATLLAKFSHLYLQEIRIDRGNAESPKAQITLKLSLVYLSSGPALIPSSIGPSPSSAGGAP